MERITRQVGQKLLEESRVVLAKFNEMEAQPWDSISTSQKIERWENVLRVLKSIPVAARKTNFDMNNWLVKKNDCDTVGCAAGWCGLDPWFQSQGFAMDMVWRTYHENPEDGFFDRAHSALAADPEDFFGRHGTNNVFYKTESTYDEVILFTEQHLYNMRAGEDLFDEDYREKDDDDYDYDDGEEY